MPTASTIPTHPCVTRVDGAGASVVGPALGSATGIATEANSAHRAFDPWGPPQHAAACTVLDRMSVAPPTHPRNVSRQRNQAPDPTDRSFLTSMLVVSVVAHQPDRIRNRAHSPWNNYGNQMRSNQLKTAQVRCI